MSLFKRHVDQPPMPEPTHSHDFAEMVKEARKDPHHFKAVQAAFKRLKGADARAFRSRKRPPR